MMFIIQYVIILILVYCCCRVDPKNPSLVWNETEYSSKLLGLCFIFIYIIIYDKHTCFNLKITQFTFYIISNVSLAFEIITIHIVVS